MTTSTEASPAIRETDGNALSLTRDEAFDRFKRVLAEADLSPSDRYRIHIAACVYASAAAQEMQLRKAASRFVWESVDPAKFVQTSYRAFPSVERALRAARADRRFSDVREAAAP